MSIDICLILSNNRAIPGSLSQRTLKKVSTAFDLCSFIPLLIIWANKRLANKVPSLTDIGRVRVYYMYCSNKMPLTNPSSPTPGEVIAKSSPLISDALIWIPQFDSGCLSQFCSTRLKSILCQ